MKSVLQLRVNGENVELLAPVHHTLLEVLREELQHTGTKHGCELGECGTCTVLINGEPALSCLLLPIEVQGCDITTVEGIAQASDLHALQQTFVELGAAQCGYCTPAMLLTAMALLHREPAPERQQIKQALAGNLCRCTGYVKILEAVELAAQRLRTHAD
jgi:aerobic-type carbon monoxide dehydrogenase small subunit (CoxS/CutS family)